MIEQNNYANTGESKAKQCASRLLAMADDSGETDDGWTEDGLSEYLCASEDWINQHYDTNKAFFEKVYEECCQLLADDF